MRSKVMTAVLVVAGCGLVGGHGAGRAAPAGPGALPGQQAFPRGRRGVRCSASRGRVSWTPTPGARPDPVASVPGCSGGRTRHSARTSAASRRCGSSASSFAGISRIGTKHTLAPERLSPSGGTLGREFRAGPGGEAGSGNLGRSRFDKRPVPASCLFAAPAVLAGSAPDRLRSCRTRVLSVRRTPLGSSFRVPSVPRA